MTSNNDPFFGAEREDGKNRGHGATLNDPNEFPQNQEEIVQRSELESEHSRLMQLQGEQTDGDELVELARRLVVQIRQLGLRLEDRQARQHWQGILSYWSIYAYRTARVDFDADLLPFDPKLAPTLREDKYPYRFDAINAREIQQMQGWRRLLDECQNDLAGDQLLTVIGDKGSGRNFLIRELLLPILQEGRTRRKELSGSENWRFITIRLEQDPVKDLVQAIAVENGQDQAWVDREVNALHKDPTNLPRLLEPDLDCRTLLMFEGFESLLRIPDVERDVLVQSLIGLLNDPARRYFFAVTLRRVQTIALRKFGPLEAPLRDGHVLLAFTTAELRHLIEDPARRIGLVFERGIVDQILIDIQGAPTALPLLQFTMRRLWDLRKKNRITREAFEKAGAGARAIQIAMDDVYARLSADQRIVLRKMLLEMAIYDPSGHFTTCQVSIQDLYRICANQIQVDDVIEELLEQGLIYTRDDGEECMASLTSSAVLTDWAPLVGWLDEQQVRKRFRLRLKEAASLWQENQQHKDLLWQGAMLLAGENEFDSDLTLTTPEQKFLHAGRRREVVKSRTRIGVISLIVALALAPMIIFPFLLRYNERQELRYREAMECLSSGDVAGTLLWLQDRKSGYDLPLIGSNAPIELVQKFAEIQLPDLTTEVLGDDPNSDQEKRSTGPTDKKFHSMVVSDNGKYAATIVSQKPNKDSKKRQCIVEIRTFHPKGAEPDENSIRRTVIPLASGKSSSGCGAFFTINQKQYLVVATGLFHLWEKADGESGWKKIKISLKSLPKDLKENASVVALDACNDFLAVTFQKPSADKRFLRLCNLVEDSEPESYSLNLIEFQPKGIDERNIKLAALSGNGDLVAVFEDKDENATLLKAWKRRDPNSWKLAIPPVWVQYLRSNNPERLYDWGWTLDDNTTGWLRDNSIIKAICFSPSGHYFATASNDGQVLMWTMGKSRTDESVIEVNPDFETELQLGSSVFDVTFLDDDIFATGGRDRTARIWNLRSGTEIVPRTYHEGTVEKIKFAGTDAFLTKTQGIFRIWQSKEYENLMAPFLAQLIDVSEDGRHVATVDDLKNVADEDGQNLNITNLNSGTSQLVSTVISPKGKWIFTASKTETNKENSENETPPDNNGSRAKMSIELRRNSSGLKESVLLTLPDENNLNEIPLTVFSRDEEWLIVAEKNAETGDLPKIYFWDLDDPDTLVSGKPTNYISVSPKRQNSVSKSKNTSTPAIPVLTFNQLAITNYGSEYVFAIVGKQSVNEGQGEKQKGVVYIGVTGTAQGRGLRRLEIVKTGSSEKIFPHKQEVLCVAFNPAGDLLATGAADDLVKLWGVKKLVELFDIQDANESISFDVKKEEVPRSAPITSIAIREFKHSSDIETLAFSPPERELLATVSSEGEAALWSIKEISKNLKADDNWTPPHKMVRIPKYKLVHEAKVLSVSFSPSGKLIITGGLDRTARIWNSEDGGPLGIFQHKYPVFEAWMPQDDHVLTVSRRAWGSDASLENNSQLRQWDVSTSSAPVGDLKLSGLENRAARRITQENKFMSLIFGNPKSERMKWSEYSSTEIGER